MLLEGIFLPLTTPFRPDGALFARKLEANVARYSLTPAAGLVVGHVEGGSLSDDEVACTLETAMHRAAEEKVMIAAVGRESVVQTLALARHAAAMHYDIVLVRAPAFAADESMRAEVLNYFRMVADRSDLPVLVESGVMPASCVAELAMHANILGALGGMVAELTMLTQAVSREVTVTSVFAAATGRMLQRGSGLLSAASLSSGNAQPVGAPGVRTRRKKVGFQVLGAQTAGMLTAWKAGASGAVPLLGPCAPQACCEVWQAFRDGDQPLAAEKQDRLLPAAVRVEGACGVAALRYGCDLNGYFGGAPRLPLFPLDGMQKAEMERLLSNLKT